MSIRLDHVRKTFGDKVAVEDLSLEIQPGEVFAFLGPNGAGKTTTIKMMVGLLRPDRGSVEVFGHAMGTDGHAAKALLAYVPDQPFVYEKLSGREFLDFVARMYGVPESEAPRRINTYIERLRLGGFIDQLAESYSHGTRQKLVLAAALLHEPRVLVVDEPLVGLDPHSIRVAKDLFRQHADAGNIVFMSTHILEIAEALANRIAIIHRGRIAALGSLAEIRREAAVHHTLEDIFLTLTEERDQVIAPGAVMR